MSQVVYGIALFISCITIWSIGYLVHLLLEQVKRRYRN